MFHISRGVWPTVQKRHFGDFVEKTSLKGCIVNNDGIRMWSDGTFAKNALEYYIGDDMHEYSGDTGDGIYRILPEGQTTPINVYCKMTDELGQGIGWMLLMLTRVGGSDLTYDDTAWGSFSPKNETLFNINPNSNTTTNVLTSVATKIKINQMWIYSLDSTTYYTTRLSCTTPNYFRDITSMTLDVKPSGWYSTLTQFQKNQSVDRTYDDYWVRFGGVIGLNTYDAWGAGIGLKHVGSGHVDHKSSTAAFERNMYYGETGVITQWANIWVR